MAYKIRSYKKSDWEQVATLIQQTYKDFVVVDGTKEANEKYLNFFDPKNERGKQFYSDGIRLVATDRNKVIGVVRGSTSHLFNLYINKEYQRKGIGSALMKEYFKKAKKAGSRLIKLRSSSNAVPFYQQLGFKKTTGVRTFMGIRCQPMKKEL